MSENTNTKAGNSNPEVSSGAKASKPTNTGKNRRRSAKSSNPKRNTTPQKVKSSEGEYILLHEARVEEGVLLGYKFQRAARVKLPNGKSHLLPLEEYIYIDVSSCWDVFPNILRVLDSENKKCKEFVSTTLPVSQHSVESKLKRYLANRPEESSVALSNQLNGSTIEAKKSDED